MEDDLATLRAEVERLRDLLDEYGIDHAPLEPPRPPQYGPPSLLEHITRAALARATTQFVKSITERNAFLSLLDGDKRPADVRMRVPIDFTINQMGKR